MFRVVFAVLFVAQFQSLVAQHGTHEKYVGFEETDDGPQIIGGEMVQGREFPHLVSLKLGSGFHYCGGSIINSEWILTAAHCFEVLLEFAQVGSNNNLFGTRHRIIEYLIHPYNDVHFQHDLAMAKVSPPIIFTNSVRPVKLPRQNQKTPVGTRATIAGWGKITRGEMRSPNLFKLDVMVQDLRKCRRSYANIYPPVQVFDTNICAGTDYNLEAPCGGDSGGSLMANGEIIGVVSFGTGICAVAFYPTVYTEVSRYISWIKYIIKTF